MSVDKLVDSTQLDSDLTSVANAIRTKGGTSAQLAFPSGFVSAVQAIPTGGGGYSARDILYGEAPSGDVVLVADADIPYNRPISGRRNISKLTIDLSAGYKFTAVSDNSHAIEYNEIPVYVIIGSSTAQETTGYLFSNNATDFIVVMRGSAGWKRMTPNAFRANAGLKLLDYTFDDSSNGITTNVFYGDDKLSTLIIRSNGVMPLSSTNSFTSNNVWKNGGTGGILYVPNDLISSYQSASNWATILGYTNNQIKSIESTHNDPTAPFDMTLYYADGTSIS